MGGAGLVASRSQPAEKRTEVIGLILGVLYSLVFFNFVDWYPAMRYHSGLTPLFFLAGVSLANVNGAGKASEPNPRRLTGLVTVGLALLSLNFGIFKDVRMQAVGSVWFADRLRAVAEWLRKNAPADALLATADAGIVPYVAGLKTVDIHPEALVDLHIAKEGFSTDYFFARNPALVLLTSRRGKLFRTSDLQILADPRFAERYRLLGVSRLNWFEDLSYRVYVRNGVAISDQAAAEFPKGIPEPALSA